nr:hypothetical protein [Myxococcota bacterium]
PPLFPETTSPAPASARPVLETLPVPTKGPPVPLQRDLQVTIAQLGVTGAASETVARRGLERAIGTLRACYRTAARTRKLTGDLDVKLAFRLDASGVATQVQVSAPPVLGALGKCAAGATGAIRTEPTGGATRVSATIRFRPS